MTGEFVLPEDVEIVRLADFPASVRAQTGGNANDYVVTRPRSRVPSKIVNAHAANFLRQFQRPTTLIEAIRRFSKMAGREPTETLEEICPFLESCLTAKLLVAPGSDSKPIRASYRVDDVVANCRVLECIQVFDDTEVYRVRTGNVKAMLKLSRAQASERARQRFSQEANILRRLNGRVAPRILSSGETQDERAYLLLQWIPGELSGEVAAAMRAYAYEPFPARLVALCAKILDGYAALHSLGVIHSDVHANNLLVMDNGVVRIIDHGLSRIDADDSEVTSPQRGGVGFFLEPEYAQAVLAGSMPPSSSFAGEQYAVAALVYFLLSGRYYMDFSYEKEEMLRQIAEQPPLTLAQRGLLGAGAMNEVLLLSLSKDPSARFCDMRTMAEAFRRATHHFRSFEKEAVSSAGVAAKAESHGLDRNLRDWLNSFLDRVSDPSIALPIHGARYPTASVTFGAAGIAFGLLRIAGTREDTGLLALSDRWLDRAASEIENDGGFYHSDIQITPETVGRISPYHTPAGIRCVQALIAHACGDSHGRSTAAEDFLRRSDQPCESVDLTLGKSGTLLALSALVDAFRWDRTAEHQHIVEAGDKLLVELWNQFDKMPSILDPEFKTYLGIAHGWAGYLYATLRWMRFSQMAAPTGVRLRLEQLAESVHWHGFRANWRNQTSPGSPVLGGWCNGSAGFVFLWSLAHRLWPNAEWLRLAEGAGRDAFHPREEGSSLCCGLIGKAYSQLHLYKYTSDRSWLSNANGLARLAVRKTEIAARAMEPQIQLSLFKGEVGLAVLISDLERPESSAFPCFEEEAWPVRAPLNRLV
jgi:eukaryotic-like serine/threonine-protein kinase